ncbi:MAG: alpha/beta fold hydrolase [Bacteroidota bacterium]
MKTTRIKFQNRDGIKLSARIELPVNSRPLAYALFAHCFTCTKNLHAITNISRALTMQGIGVFRFDFTGLGESEGEFEGTNFSSNVDDLIDAAGFMEDEYRAPSILIGHSLGGAAVIFAANRLENVKAVVTIATPSSPAHLKDVLQSSHKEIEEKGHAKVSLGGQPFTITKQFLDNLEEQNMKKNLRSLEAALLIMHSPDDNIVGIENATELYKMARHSRSFISLDGADHVLSDKKDSYHAGEMAAVWAKKYLPQEEEENQPSSQVMARLTGESYITEIQSGKHSFLADEPKSAGGDDMGPSPYDIVTAGLGACTSMTLRMYANRKKWDLREVRVHLDHSKKHIEDCATCDESDDSKIDNFNRVIELEGDLDADQRNRLLEIANKCPVHRTLTGNIVIDTKLK